MLPAKRPTLTRAVRQARTQVAYIGGMEG